MVEWWYIKNDNRLGPVSQDKLLRLFSIHEVKPDTLIWHPGMSDWKQFEEMREVLDTAPPPIPLTNNAVSSFASKEQDLLKQLNKKVPTWSRWFSRQFDVYWEVGLIAFAGAFLLELLVPRSADWFSRTGNGPLFGLFCVPLAFVLDALIASIFRNTPGKALNGINIITEKGEPLTFLQHLQRNLTIWITGFAFGVPFIAIFCQIYQYRRLKRGKKASEDEGENYLIVRTEPGLARKSAFVLAYMLLVSTLALFNSKSLDNRQNSIASNKEFAKLNYSWTNPLTNRTTAIDSAWNASSTTDKENESVFSFYHSSGNAVVTFAAETIPNVSIKQYVVALQSANSSATKFADDDGSFSVVDGHSTWAGSGIMIDDHEQRLTLVVIQFGSTFWRQGVVEVKPYGQISVQIQKLSSSLWQTIY